MHPSPGSFRHSRPTGRAYHDITADAPVRRADAPPRSAAATPSPYSTRCWLPVAAHSHQHKPALPPETPQLVGIAKADREIIFSAGTADQPLADAFPLAIGMNRNAADASAFQRRRERRAAVRCQRLRHQISTRPTKARPDCAAKFRG